MRPKSPPNSSSATDNVFSVAATFASPRLWVTSSTLNVERSMLERSFAGFVVVAVSVCSLRC